jgi:hypothetical protein
MPWHSSAFFTYTLYGICAYVQELLRATCCPPKGCTAIHRPGSSALRLFFSLCSLNCPLSSAHSTQLLAELDTGGEEFGNVTAALAQIKGAFERCVCRCTLFSTDTWCLWRTAKYSRLSPHSILYTKYLHQSYSIAWIVRCLEVRCPTSF